MKKLKIIITFILLASLFLGIVACTPDEESKADVSEDVNNTVSTNADSSEPRIISFGLPEPSTKPVSQKISSRTYSYYKKGEKITVELYMGDTYSDHQKLGITPSYDTYGTNGYPMLRVYEAYDVGVDIKQDSVFLFNSINTLYEKKFSGEDMESLDNTGEGAEFYKPTSEWHSETIQIDFSALKPGDYGRICLGFGWFYPDYPNSSEPVQNKFDYYNNFLSYYVSEKGIALSYLGWENAQKEAEAIEGKALQTNELICAAKPLYLYCNDAKEQYIHGTNISN